MQISAQDPSKIKEISEDIIKSMLKRSYPAVNATHYFKKYADGNTPDHQFMHSIAMMEEGGLIRMDHKKDPFSVTFVLMENGKPKMHHMIDDDYKSDTYGSMMNDPYEGDKKRVHCFRHIMNDEKAKHPDCEKCKLEENSMICMQHENILSKCVECKKSSALLKAVTPKDKAPEVITAILKKYKAEYWSFSN
jgi:hypothetical protein